MDRIDPIHLIIYVTAAPYYLNEIRQLHAKRVWGESSIEGSNTSLSAIVNDRAGFRVSEIGYSTID